MLPQPTAAWRNGELLSDCNNGLLANFSIADNYALFALAKYIQPIIGDKYAWFPLRRAVRSSDVIVAPAGRYGWQLNVTKYLDLYTGTLNDMLKKGSRKIPEIMQSTPDNFLDPTPVVGEDKYPKDYSEAYDQFKQHIQSTSPKTGLVANGNLKCENTALSPRILHRGAPQKLENTCFCWYSGAPDTTDLFCKPPGTKCSDITQLPTSKYDENKGCS